MTNKLRNSIGCLAVLGIAIMMAMSANTLFTVADVESVGALEMPVINQDYDTGTSVEWHGTLDLFIKEDGSDDWEQVVYGKPNLLTNGGADRLRGFLNGTVVSGETIANLSLSDDATAASAAWTELPAEIVANGLERAEGTMADNGTGAFNITYTWTATASQDCQLIGTHWDTSGDGNLFSALDFAQQTLLVNDQLQAIYSVEIS